MCYCLYDRETHIILPYIVEQEPLVTPEKLISPPVFSVVRDVDSLVFCVVFCRHWLSFFPLFFTFYCCKASWLPPFLDVFEIFLQDDIQSVLGHFSSSWKHKIQIYNKNVYLLHIIAHSRGFYFIKGNPNKNYTDKNHFVSKSIQNRKNIFFKLNMYTFVIHIIQVLFPGKDTQALIGVWW